MSYSKGDLKVLFVDDLLTVRRVLRHFLIEVGFRPENIFEASDGLEAQQMLTEMEVDLIICDWNMPRLSGVELTEWVRANKRLAHIPIVMATVNRGADHVLKASQKGVSAYLKKPFRVDRLKQQIDGLLHQQAA